MSFYNFAKCLVNIVFKGFYKIKYVGLENIPDSPFLLCSNHLSYCDPILVALPLKQEMHFMAKYELFKIPLLNVIIKKLGAFPVKRGHANVESIDTAINLLKEGNSLLIFPEGTRSKTGEPQKPKSGAALIAHRANIQVLPAAIKMQNRKLFRSLVTVTYGKPITPQELNIDHPTSNALKDASQIIMGRILNMFYDNEVQDNTNE